MNGRDDKAAITSERKAGAMIKIWGRNTSVNVQKVMWAVGELELPHERIDVGGAFGKNKEPAYLAMNPNAWCRRSKKRTASCCGNRTRSCATSRPNTAPASSSPPMRTRAHAPAAEIGRASCR